MSAPEFHFWREGDLWVIDVPGYGITQAETEADCARMAADLVEQTRAAKIEAFEGAPDAEESLRQRVAEVISNMTDDAKYGGVAVADAVLAVMRGDDA